MDALEEALLEQQRRQMTHDGPPPSVFEGATGAIDRSLGLEPGSAAGAYHAWKDWRDANRERMLSDPRILAEGLLGGALNGRGLMRVLRASKQKGMSPAVVSRSPSLYNPPSKPARPFEADYPNGVSVDEAGRLTHDIEGRPLVAPLIAGRRSAAGVDEGLRPEDVVAVGAGSTGQAVAPVPKSGLPRNAIGAYLESYAPNGELERSIRFDRTLPPDKAARVVAHETGHALDEIAGQIPTAGLSAELSRLYNTLNTGQERTRNLTGPQHLGYRKDEAPREFMAEALRAYMTDPNYIKTVAPKTAATIRAAINDHPRLSQVVQFNAGVPAGMFGSRVIGADEEAGDESRQLLVKYLSSP